MVFKRRKPRTYYEVVSESVYPRGGWWRATRYVVHRLRRLPDPAHKISRGIAAGVFVCFTPLFGMHFVLAAALAWLIRGNVLAALLATFVGNPVTIPLIAAISMEIGSWMLGYRHAPPLPVVLQAFTEATLDLWRNFLALFTSETTHWSGLLQFWRRVFLPYLIGGVPPGIAAAIAFYVLSNPVLAAYQRARVARLKRRFARKRELVISRRLEAADAVEALKAREKDAAE